MARQAQAATNKKMKSLIETKMEKSDEKLDSMTVLMLHYCAGLQHCLDQEELARLKQLEQDQEKEDGDETCAEQRDINSVLECVGTEQGHINISDSSTSIEVTTSQDRELDTTAATLTDRSEETEVSAESLMTDIMAINASSEDEDELVQHITSVLNNEAVHSVSPGDHDSTTETCRETAEAAETDTSTVVTSSTEQNVSMEEAREHSEPDLLSDDISNENDMHLNPTV